MIWMIRTRFRDTIILHMKLSCVNNEKILYVGDVKNDNGKLNSAENGEEEYKRQKM